MKKVFFITLFIFLCSSLFAGKILFIDSYHEGYEWSAGVRIGTKKTIGNKHELKIFSMDTKRNKSEEFKVNAGIKAKELIESWQPDVVICSDDNAVKYVIVPFFMDSKIPFVFTGVNWDASIYGLPVKNVTGMVTIAHVDKLLRELSKQTDGNRIGFIGTDNLTCRKEAEYMQKRFDINFVSENYAKTYEEFTAEYIKLQEMCDIIIFENYAGIKGWDHDVAKEFILQNTKVPTGSFQEFISDFVLVSYAKLSIEHGQWAARTAMEIINGADPADIPIADNKKFMILRNEALANKLGLEYPPAAFKPMLIN